MDISRINAAIEQIGYNPSGVQGTGDADVQKFAQQNGISVEEAKSILQEAQEKAEENDKIMAQEGALMAEMLNRPDEEEIQIIDDDDFDSFLKEESPEQKMQDIFSQQAVAKQNNTQNSQQPQNAQNIFAQEDNPFMKMKF